VHINRLVLSADLSCAIHAGDQDILHPPVLQLREHLQPELSSLLLRHPQSQDFLLPAGPLTTLGSANLTLVAPKPDRPEYKLIGGLETSYTNTGRPRRHLRSNTATAEEAKQNLEELTLKWDAYPSLSQVWQRNWDRITPFFHYPADIRKAIYTTNSVEALHRSLRKIIKTRGAFPNEESALKLLFLAIRQASKKWTMPVKNWSQALNYFTVLWPERMPRPGRSA
jgi:hypothetical protein